MHLRRQLGGRASTSHGKAFGNPSDAYRAAGRGNRIVTLVIIVFIAIALAFIWAAYEIGYTKGLDDGSADEMDRITERHKRMARFQDNDK